MRDQFSRTIQPSNAEKQTSLPKYDWPIKMVNVTPDVTRTSSYELKNIEGREQLNFSFI